MKAKTIKEIISRRYQLASWLFSNQKKPSLVNYFFAITLPCVIVIIASCTKSHSSVVDQNGIQTDSVEINLREPWTLTNINLVAGQNFTIDAAGQMNWYTGQCNGGCVSTPSGIGNNCASGFVDASLRCWSLIAKIGANGQPFQVGEHFSGIADNAGQLILGVNDNNFSDNTGRWSALVTSTVPACQADPNTYVPLPGDVPNLNKEVFEPQKLGEWCWIATARMLMKQVSPASTMSQCKIFDTVRNLNGYCCLEQNLNNTSTICNSGEAIYFAEIAKAMTIYGYSFDNTFLNFSIFSTVPVPTETEFFNELAIHRRPIAYSFYWAGQGQSGFHYEVIYGFYYVGQEMHIRIWDPGLAQHFRCNTLKAFPEPIPSANGNLTIKTILGYYFNGRKK